MEGIGAVSGKKMEREVVGLARWDGCVLVGVEVVVEASIGGSVLGADLTRVLKVRIRR